MDEFTFQNDCLILGKTLSRQFHRFVKDLYGTGENLHASACVGAYAHSHWRTGSLIRGKRAEGIAAKVVNMISIEC